MSDSRKENFFKQVDISSEDSGKQETKESKILNSLEETENSSDGGKGLKTWIATRVWGKSCKANDLNTGENIENANEDSLINFTLQHR